MTKRRGPKAKVTINTRVEENPDEFRIDNGLLFCNFCNHSIDWVRKSTVDDHLNSITHKIKKICMKMDNVYISKHLKLLLLLLNQKKL